MGCLQHSVTGQRENVRIAFTFLRKTAALIMIMLGMRFDFIVI